MSSYHSINQIGNPSARFLYLTLKELAPTGTVKVSHERLATLIGKCRRTVIRLCDILEEAGFIEVERAPVAAQIKAHAPNTYTLPLVIAELAKSTRNVTPDSKDDDSNTKDQESSESWSDEQEQAFQKLRRAIKNIHPDTLRKLLLKYTAAQIHAALAWVQRQKNVRNLAGYVIWALRAEIAPPPRTKYATGHRYDSGSLAHCIEH